VLMEKPMSLHAYEAEQLVEIAKQSKGELFIRHNRRFDHDFLHVYEIIQSGKLGDVYEVRINRHGYQRRDDWQTIKEFGGGQLLNWGPHIIDHALQFLESPVKELWRDLRQVAAAGDAEDHVKIILTGENNRVVELEISGGVAIPAPRYMVYGTKGSLLFEDNKIKLRYLDPEQRLEEKVADPGTPGEGFGSEDHLTWIEQSFRGDEGHFTCQRRYIFPNIMTLNVIGL